MPSICPILPLFFTNIMSENQELQQGQIVSGRVENTKRLILRLFKSFCCASVGNVKLIQAGRENFQLKTEDIYFISYAAGDKS